MIQTKIKHNWKVERKAQEMTVEVINTDFVHNRGALRVVHRAVTYINVPTMIFDSLLCSRYSHARRMTTGVLVMVLGVAVAKVAGHNPVLWIAGLGDMIGYAVHGMGLTPFAVYLSERFEKKEQK